MNKKLFIVAIAVLVVGAAAFLLLQKEDPLMTQAKDEVRRANETHLAFQNRVNAIPSLEISREVESDFQMESSFFGTFGYIVPDVGGFGDPRAEAAFSKFISAQSARGSSRIAFDPDEPFERFAQSAEALGEVTGEDLTALERLANTFDAAIAAARADVLELVVLTVERNEKTEKRFQEFERILVKHEALVSSLDRYSSADFRVKVERLKAANTAFRGFPIYLDALVKGTAGGYSFNFASVFPEAAAEEASVRDCAFRPGKAGCAHVGPFPGHLQELMRILADSYGSLVE